jgi:hypothetical protein
MKFAKNRKKGKSEATIAPASRQRRNGNGGIDFFFYFGAASKQVLCYQPSPGCRVILEKRVLVHRFLLSELFRQKCTDQSHLLAAASVAAGKLDQAAKDFLLTKPGRLFLSRQSTGKKKKRRIIRPSIRIPPISHLQSNKLKIVPKICMNLHKIQLKWPLR